MRKFNFDDDDSREGEFFDEMSDGENMFEEGLSLEENMYFVSQNSNLQLLDLAIQEASKSFFWKFYSAKTKIDSIQAIYKGLKEIVD